jgi:hypothetical protein
MSPYRRTSTLGSIMCLIVLVGTPGLAGAQGGLDAVRNKTARAEPCCNVTAVDVATGTVSVKLLATGAITSFAVRDRATISQFTIGTTLAFQAAPEPACTSNAATSSGTGTNCGSNVGRNADTRPKECIATNSAGQQYRVACPTGVPIKQSN